MALKIADLVKETTTTSGTGAYVLGGAVSGFRTFASALGNGDTAYYACAGADSGGAAAWEVGIGTFSSGGNSLARTTILASSNANAAVNWLAGVSKLVHITGPAIRTLLLDAAGTGMIGLPVNLTLSGLTGTLTLPGSMSVLGTTSLGGVAGAESLRVTPVASAVNRIEVSGGAVGGTPYMFATGSDPNVSFSLYTKGSGAIGFFTNSSTLQAAINHTASANRYLTLTGSNGGNPTIGVSAGSLGISAPLGLTNQVTSTASPTAGAAGALPATPQGYLAIAINGTNYRIPFYPF